MKWAMMAAITLGLAGITAAAGAAVRAKNISHGLWWDDGRQWTTKNWIRLAGELRSMGIDHIVVNTNGHEAAIAGHADGRWTAAQLGALRGLSKLVDVHAMVWCAPNRAFANSFGRYCKELYAAGIRVVELDAERDAWGTAVTGFASREAAAAELIRVAKAAGLTVGVTMIPERMYPEFFGADYVAVQAYSRYNKGTANHGYGQAYGPGRMQELAYRRAKQARLPLVTGLAAYDQDWHGSKELADLHGMTLAYDTARQLSRSIRWWSSKWLVGHRAQPAVRARIAKLIAQNR